LIVNQKQLNIIEEAINQVISRLNLVKLKNKRIFITGGTGFFGMWLLNTIKLLNDLNYSIQVVAVSRDPGVFLCRFPNFQNVNWIRFIKGDIKTFVIPEEEFDYIIHAATETSLDAHANAEKMFDDILFGMKRVVEVGKTCKAKRMLLTSSGAVYGRQPAGVTHQLDNSPYACDTLKTSSAYGEGKRTMELLGIMAQQEHGIDSIVARCFSFAGPGIPLNAHYAIGNFIRDALYEKKITINGNGTSMRSYLHGADLAVWLLYLLLHGRAGEAYNVGSDESISILDLAHLVRDIVSKNKPIIKLNKYNKENNDRHFYVPAITKARGLGCLPWTSLSESISLTAKYSIS